MNTLHSDHRAKLWWAIDGVLAGTRVPNIDRERRGGNAPAAYNDDLTLIQQAGIRAIVSLLNHPGDLPIFQSAGFEFKCLPIPDGYAPSLNQAREFIEFVVSCRKRNLAVAVFCIGGIGRTGTMLAAYLIHTGLSASEAVAHLRTREPSAVETPMQMAFLRDFELIGRKGTARSQPVNLWWAIDGVLAGMGIPYIDPERRLNPGSALEAYADELPALHREGIRAVVCLLNIPNDREVLEAAGFEFRCLPIRDGQAPTMEQAKEFVDFVDSCRVRNLPAAVFCEAGVGRTGTMLAAYLIHLGMSATEAIARVRAKEPWAVETMNQIRFLMEFEQQRKP